MRITLIAAVAENRVIGRGNALPWHLPDDLKRFKRLTLGRAVIMGRRTFESLEESLPERRSIVITRDPDFCAPGASVGNTLEDALGCARDAGEAEVFILGGADIFALALPLADRMELTVVHADVEGDTLFPEWNPSAWTLVDDERHEADDRHAHAFSFRTYVRATPSR